MSKLLDKLKKEAAELKESEGKSKFSKFDWFKPEKGDNILRLLPHPTDPEDVFFKKVYIHYGVSINGEDGKIHKIPARCLVDFEETCPLCEESESLADAGDKDGSKNLRRSERVLYNILDYKAKKVKTWACPPSVHRKFFTWISEIGEEPSDLDLGRNWKVVKQVDPGKPAQFGTSYEIFPDMKQSAVPKKLRSLCEDLPDFDTAYSENHRAAMNEMLGIEGEPKKTTAGKFKRKEKIATKREVIEDEEDGDDEDVVGFDTGVDQDLEAELKRLNI